MFNFVESLKIGLSHAEEAQKNSEEINSVFEMLRSDIEKHTNSNVSIKFSSSIDDGSDDMITHAIALLNTRKRRKYTALMALNIVGRFTFEKELCEWENGDKGYPVTISYLNRTTECADKESLVQRLQDLLSQPDVGKKIKFLLDKART